MVFLWFSYGFPIPRSLFSSPWRRPNQDFHIDRNLDTVLGALRRLGIEAEKKGRNDAWIDI